MAVPLLLAAAVALFYWKLTLSRQYSWLDSPDFAYQVLPWFQFQAGEWHAGRIPLWSPYEWGGQSLIGQAQPGAAYPLNWILFLLPLRDGWIEQAYLHWYWVLIHYMGVLFAYWLCRDLKCSRAASALGGLAFGLGGWMGSTEWPQMLNGAVWLPVVIQFLLRAARGQRELPSAGLAGAALGMAFLSGHHQAPTYIALAAGGIWVWMLAAEPAAWKRRAVALAVFGAVLALVSALQVLPAYEYGKLAVRWVGAANDPLGWKDPVPYKVHSHFSLYPISMAGIVVPGILRHASPYMGVVVFVLSLIGAAARWSAREVRALAAIALGGPMLALAQFSVFHGLAYALVPMVEKARNPSMAILLFHFGAAMLAAFGADAVMARDERAKPWMRRAAIALAVFAAYLLLVLLGLTAAGSQKLNEYDRAMLVPALALIVAGVLLGARRGSLSPGAAISLLLAAAVFEFGVAGSAQGIRHRDDPGSMLGRLARDSDLARFLEAQPGPPRMEADTDALPYNFGEWYGMDVFDTYTASVQTNIYRIQADYAARMLLGMAYYIGPKPSRKSQVQVFRSAGGLNVYANPEACPRAWSVHEVERVAESEVPSQWQRRVGDLRQKAFLTAAPPALERCDSTSDRVRMVLREAGRIVIEARMGCRGLVVAGEPSFPGWEATVDGRPAPIHEVYSMMRGVVAEAGDHRIEMRYRPWPVRIGAAGTAIGLLIAGALAVAGRRRSG